MASVVLFFHFVLFFRNCSTRVRAPVGDIPSLIHGANATRPLDFLPANARRRKFIGNATIARGRHSPLLGILASKSLWLARYDVSEKRKASWTQEQP